MKKIVSLLVFTLLAVVGYYIGAAVAQNNNPAAMQNPDGVMVIEEEYDVLVPDSADDAATTSDTDTDADAAMVKAPVDAAKADADKTDSTPAASMYILCK